MTNGIALRVITASITSMMIGCGGCALDPCSVGVEIDASSSGSQEISSAVARVTEHTSTRLALDADGVELVAEMSATEGLDLRPIDEEVSVDLWFVGAEDGLIQAQVLDSEQRLFFQTVIAAPGFPNGGIVVPKQPVERCANPEGIASLSAGIRFDNDGIPAVVSPGEKRLIHDNGLAFVAEVATAYTSEDGDTPFGLGVLRRVVE